MTRRIHTLFSVVSSLVVVLTVVWGILLVGSPGTARMRRFDGQRLRDLQTIFREVQLLCHDPDIVHCYPGLGELCMYFCYIRFRQSLVSIPGQPPSLFAEPLRVSLRLRLLSRCVSANT